MNSVLFFLVKEKKLLQVATKVFMANDVPVTLMSQLSMNSPIVKRTVSLKRHGKNNQEQMEQVVNFQTDQKQ